jgi:glyoxylase-like metal-dependent hydrolase (beta-lactamase superfamily II)
VSPPDSSRRADELAALAFPHASPPSPGALTEVAPGIHWLRMPLPFVLDHINLWLLADGDGWTIVDTGIDSAATRDIWERIFQEQLGGRKVTRVICTHFHPDHMGLAGWLTRRWNAPLWTTEGEWLWGRMLSLDRDDAAFAEEQRPFYARTGVDAETVAAFAGRGNQYAPRVSPLPRGFRRIAEGDELSIGGRSWRVVIGRGHAPEHACLHCAEEDIFIAGDMVLPKISPNVSVWPTEPEGNPLARYLESIQALRRLVPPEVLVLPSHGLPFRGLHTRIDQLEAHHRERLDTILAACATPQSAIEIVPLLFRRHLDSHQLGFAIGEALAHLNLLLAEGRLSRSEDATGVYRYMTA